MIESKLDMNASWMVTFKIGIFLYGTEIQMGCHHGTYFFNKGWYGKINRSVFLEKVQK